MKKLLTPIALAAGLLCATAAHAELELHGYFRTQAGTTSAGGIIHYFGNQNVIAFIITKVQFVSNPNFSSRINQYIP